MSIYTVYLKTTDAPIPVSADKFSCDQDGNTVFYARPAAGEKFAEVASFLTSNIKRIEED